MAGREVAALGSTIIAIVSKIQELGDNYYKASQAWKDFPRQVEHLRRHHEAWQAKLTEFGMLSDSALLKSLHEAEGLLKQEEAELSRREAKVKGPRRLWLKSSNLLSKMVFPAQLDNSIQMVNDAYEEILASLKSQNEAAAELHSSTLGKPLPLLIRNDKRYVRLEVSETAIRVALDSDNSSDGPVVVLLHGGPGRGKTILARFMAVHYDTSATGKALFNHVVYLECGLTADTLSKQLELLQLLGSCVEDAWQEKGSSNPKVIILKLLTSRLRDQKLLLVLDDVWEPQFLQTMVDLSGCRVKFLVTSQRLDLCDGLNCPTIHRVRIQDIGVQEGRKILASHVSLPDQHIPLSHEKIADKMIKAAEANPLALACIASAIDKTRSLEVEEWDAAGENLFQLLHLESTAQILGKQYPTSFWSAMQLCFKSLTNEQKTLLILLHMCDAPSIPEEVIHILVRNTTVQRNSVLFARSREQLESRQLMSISHAYHPTKHRSWSLHSLHKKFIDEEMRGVIESTFTSLSRAWDVHTKSTVEPEINVDFSEDKVAIALSALYYRAQFAKPASSKLGVPFERFSKVRQRAILPVTRLIARGITEEWTQTLRTSARKVFFKYICYSVFDDKGISDLLSSTVSVDAMLSVLHAVSLIEQPLLDENTPLIIAALTDLLGDIDAVNLGAREDAARVLKHFCHNDQHDTFVMSKCPGVLEAALRTITTDSHHLEMQAVSCSILLCWSNSDSYSILKSILEYPGALVCLVKFLTIENPFLNKCAVGALANLAKKPAHCIKIANATGALEGLVRSLSKDNIPDIQEQAARALLSLAFVDEEVKFKLEKVPGALAELVHSLSKDNNPGLQMNAAGALVNLTFGDVEVNSKIANVPGALEQLKHSLSKDNNPGLQWKVAKALVNLTFQNEEVKSKISNVPGALEELVHSLSKDNNPRLQENAAGALLNLTFADNEMKWKIANVPGALEKLLHSLSNDNNPGLQKDAATALLNLTFGNNEVKSKIANVPGALEELVHSLSKDNPGLPEIAARALLNLTFKDNEVKWKIANVSGALEKLRHSLSNVKNPALQNNAAQILGNMAKGILASGGGEAEYAKQDWNAIEGLVDGLLDLLASQLSPRTQMVAARALTLIDPAGGNDPHLYSASAYSGRGRANLLLGRYQETLADLDNAIELKPGDDVLKNILGCRCTVRAKVGDFQGALADANQAVEICRKPFYLQERGVVKRMMGDLAGALADFTEGLDMETDDYETLKHRGYVKFLMEDEEGARGDAEWALRIKPPLVDEPGYGLGCLGTGSIEYLGYKL